MSNILINLFYGQSVYVLLTKAARSIFVKMYFCTYGDDGVYPETIVNVYDHAQ